MTYVSFNPNKTHSNYLGPPETISHLCTDWKTWHVLNTFSEIRDWIVAWQIRHWLSTQLELRLFSETIWFLGMTCRNSGLCVPDISRVFSLLPHNYNLRGRKGWQSCHHDNFRFCVLTKFKVFSATHLFTHWLWALSYYGALVLSQDFQPMAAQLSKKAALPLAQFLRQRHVVVVRQGPEDTV